MIHTNRFSTLRTWYCIAIAIVFIIANTLMCSLASVLIDKYICIIAINICFFCLFILLLIRKRLHGNLPESNFISYGKICLVVIIVWAITIICSAFIPGFFAPLIVIPIIISTVFDEALVNIFSLYLVIISSICLEYNVNLVLCYLTMVLFGSIFANLLKNAEAMQGLYIIVSLFAVTTLISIIFYYFNYLELSYSVFIYGVLCGFVSCVITVTVFPLLNTFVTKAQNIIYDSFLSEDFVLYNEIRNFSYIEFQHAKRISSLSKKCAAAINANEDLAECAAFYYRLGKIEGEPIIDNAIKLANNYCLPYDVIQIISEYGGIVSLPSTKESAIVHMVDSVVTKVELFDSDSMSSSWNQNMVIYQTINELSQKGFYDNSGLTMNQFLVIREILANEDMLA